MMEELRSAALSFRCFTSEFTVTSVMFITLFFLGNVNGFLKVVQHAAIHS